MVSDWPQSRESIRFIIYSSKKEAASVIIIIKFQQPNLAVDTSLPHRLS